MADEQHSQGDTQREHWESVWAAKPALFGVEHSAAARAAVRAFRLEGCRRLLELGAGQGRDTLFFGQNGFHVTALDYSQAATERIAIRAQALEKPRLIQTVCHDIRVRLPFEDASFDACYSHLLFCMALRMDELEGLAGEVCRVLRPGGLHIYTARTTEDPQYGTGSQRGPDMYEISGGFIVHFFSETTVARLTQGFELLAVDHLEEGSLPRKLFQVTLRKKRAD